MRNCLIHAGNLEQEVIFEKKPVLILCMPLNDQFSQQKKILEELAAERLAEIKTGLIREDFIEPFRKNYGVKGTPTFLVLKKGQEVGRLLGVAERSTLSRWLDEIIGISE